ncbi:zinc finger protein CONSTANS-LIKE 9-like isoform X2 [Camellia sinensis]|uniref:zinc finger protein CONSTANS-LIKE 9-like isoform X2 n=1 Tax=Camellia sinensis TaxID=4442 RepID=UPI001035911F|nr:zinc finger protein CONSTANS-LIKE 9-like isoform X2 [Camellia sinensis]XP_028076140.1 zinc finger protein CONSTANS-LIKE 9-like isoform X2 [Camellia sinensis]XP_028076141.1 zinc finger protein CONSTANS-LIKE 9-like isoform X2 [Camellia sinensis]
MFSVTTRLITTYVVGLGLGETCCPGTKARDLEEDDKFYEDFNMDEVDLNIENYEETFGVALNDPEQLFGNDGIGSLFGVKDMSGADLNHRGTYAAEGSSIRLVKSMQPAISNPASADSVISSKTDPNLCFAMQAHSSISFFVLAWRVVLQIIKTGASPMFLMGKPPPLCLESSLPSTSRSSAVMSYMEKKKTRK